MVLFVGLTEIDMKVNSTRTTLKDMDDIPGLMVDNMKGFGKITKCMELVFSNGKMARNTPKIIFFCV